MKSIPKEVKEAAEVHNSLKELFDKKDYYEKLDGLEESEQLDRLYEYRDKLFSILKKTQSIETRDVSFEPVRNTIINLIKKILNWTEQSLVLLAGSEEIPSEDGYREMCREYAIEYASLFYKLPVSDDYSGFMERWVWVVNNVAKKHLKVNSENNHTKFLLGNEYKISSDDLEYLIGNYFMKDVRANLYENSPWFMFDKKETEFLKKGLISELREKYPDATGSCKSFLLSNKNWNALCEDFFEKERQEILNRINESNVLENSKNSFTLIVIISVFLDSYLESRILNKKFEDYMIMRAEKEFELSQQKKLKISQQNSKKTIVKEEPIIESKSESQKKDLPLGMEDDIKNMDIIDVNQLIKFLKNELTNFGGHIKMSHLKDRLTRMSEIESLPDVLALLDNYPEFIIEEDEKSEAEEVVSSDGDLEYIEKGKEATAEELLLNKLFEVSNKSDIEERLSGYISIFEDLGFKFRDKEDFLLQLKDAADRTEKGCLEKSIQIALKFRIHGNESLSKKWAFGYRAICLNHRAWRIVLTNMEITHILSHSEYEKLINTKPSQK